MHANYFSKIFYMKFSTQNSFIQILSRFLTLETTVLCIAAGSFMAGRWHQVGVASFIVATAKISFAQQVVANVAADACVGSGQWGTLRNSVGIPNGILILTSDEFTSTP
jgi:hypothetical protein